MLAAVFAGYSGGGSGGGCGGLILLVLTHAMSVADGSYSNVALLAAGASCTASENEEICDESFNGDVTDGWMMQAWSTSAWLKVTFQQTYVIAVVRLLVQVNSYSWIYGATSEAYEVAYEAMYETKLSFDDDEQQSYTLELDAQDSWNEYILHPQVKTRSARLQVDSIVSPQVSFLELQFHQPSEVTRLASAGASCLVSPENAIIGPDLTCEEAIDEMTNENAGHWLTRNASPNTTLKLTFIDSHLVNEVRLSMDSSSRGIETVRLGFDNKVSIRVQLPIVNEVDYWMVSIPMDPVRTQKMTVRLVTSDRRAESPDARRVVGLQEIQVFSVYPRLQMYITSAEAVCQPLPAEPASPSILMSRGLQLGQLTDRDWKSCTEFRPVDRELFVIQVPVPAGTREARLLVIGPSKCSLVSVRANRGRGDSTVICTARVLTARDRSSGRAVGCDFRCAADQNKDDRYYELVYILIRDVGFTICELA